MEEGQWLEPEVSSQAYELAIKFLELSAWMATQQVQQNFLWQWGYSVSPLSSIVATNHVWLLSIWNMASTSENWIFNFT